MHEYCIDWTEDTLTWSIDGNDQRTLNRKDTWNATAGRFNYPQTPARIMLSLWPAGLPSNAPGTIAWAGGEIDWNSPYMTNGYYAARFQEVTVDCYDPPAEAQIKGKKTYKYTDESGTNNTVAITDDYVILGSLMGTGENPGKPIKSGDPQPTQSVAMVPGGNPGGGAGREVETTAAATQSGSTAQQTAGTANSGTSSSGQFVQGGSSNGGSSSGAASVLQPSLGWMCGSVGSIVVAVLGLMAL